MSLYIRRNIVLQVSRDQGMKNASIRRGDALTYLNEVSTLAEAIDAAVVIPAPQTDMPLSFPPGITTGRMFYLETDTDLTIKFNGTDATRAIDVKVPSSDVPGILLMDVDFSAVYLSLTGTTAANVYFAIVGS